MSEIQSTPPTVKTIKLQTSKKDKFLIVSATTAKNGIHVQIKFGAKILWQHYLESPKTIIPIFYNNIILVTRKT